MFNRWIIPIRQYNINNNTRFIKYYVLFNNSSVTLPFLIHNNSISYTTPSYQSIKPAENILRNTSLHIANEYDGSNKFGNNKELYDIDLSSADKLLNSCICKGDYKEFIKVYNRLFDYRIKYTNSNGDSKQFCLFDDNKIYWQNQQLLILCLAISYYNNTNKNDNNINSNHLDMGETIFESHLCRLAVELPKDNCIMDEFITSKYNHPWLASAINEDKDNRLLYNNNYSNIVNWDSYLISLRNDLTTKYNLNDHCNDIFPQSLQFRLLNKVYNNNNNIDKHCDHELISILIVELMYIIESQQSRYPYQSFKIQSANFSLLAFLLSIHTIHTVNNNIINSLVNIYEMMIKFTYTPTLMVFNSILYTIFTQLYHAIQYNKMNYTINSIDLRYYHEILNKIYISSKNISMEYVNIRPHEINTINNNKSEMHRRIVQISPNKETYNIITNIYHLLLVNHNDSICISPHNIRLMLSHYRKYCAAASGCAKVTLFYINSTQFILNQLFNTHNNLHNNTNKITNYPVHSTIKYYISELLNAASRNNAIDISNIWNNYCSLGLLRDINIYTILLTSYAKCIPISPFVFVHLFKCIQIDKIPLNFNIIHIFAQCCLTSMQYYRYLQPFEHKLNDIITINQYNQNNNMQLLNGKQVKQFNLLLDNIYNTINNKSVIECVSHLPIRSNFIDINHLQSFNYPIPTQLTNQFTLPKFNIKAPNYKYQT